MQITIFSFFSSVVWYSAFVITIYLLRKEKHLKNCFGISSIVLLYLISTVRMFLPLDFANAIILESKTIYPKIYQIFSAKIDLWNGISISLYLALIGVWIGGIFVLGARYAIQYHKSLRGIYRYASPAGQREQSALCLVKQTAGRNLHICILTVPNISTPFGVGVLHKKILLPERSYSDTELHYIMLHEYTHFLEKDVIIKFLVSVFCIIFWWNPIVYLLKTGLEQSLEIKCDERVSKSLNKQEKVLYLQTIVNALKNTASTSVIPYASTAFFTGEGTEVKERFAAVISQHKRGENSAINALIMFVFALFALLTYFVIPQPVFEAPVNTNGVDAVAFDTSNAYLTEDSGGYELYVDNKSQGNISAQAAEMYLKDGFIIMNHCCYHIIGDLQKNE